MFGTETPNRRENEMPAKGMAYGQTYLPREVGALISARLKRDIYLRQGPARGCDQLVACIGGDDLAGVPAKKTIAGSLFKLPDDPTNRSPWQVQTPAGGCKTAAVSYCDRHPQRSDLYQIDCHLFRVSLSKI
ncbi:MAG: hypothetical protein QNJ35_15065 [Paracoccaceae bacterium]|nr:hypothetical protein [Paracoccaceae bacterium]